MEDKTKHPPSKVMEWIVFSVYFLNIFVAAFTHYSNEGNITNFICGVVLALTVPLPAKILYNEHGYKIDTGEENDLLDVIALNQTPEWIVSYVSWNVCFLWDYSPRTIFWFPLHLLPCFIRSFLNRSYFLFMIHTPDAQNEAIIPEVFNGNKFKDVVFVSNQRLLFEIWGGINLIVALVHAVKWILWIKKNRAVAQMAATDEDGIAD
eukprot:119095_1